MSESLSERRLAENEVLFRESNKEIAEGFSELKSVAQEEGYSEWAEQADKPVGFYCECSNKNCRERIKLRPSEYNDIHQNTSQFVVLPGHNLPKIERIVHSNKEYLVVEKYLTPPRPKKQ